MSKYSATNNHTAKKAKPIKMFKEMGRSGYSLQHRQLWRNHHGKLLPSSSLLQPFRSAAAFSGCLIREHSLCPGHWYGCVEVVWVSHTTSRMVTSHSLRKGAQKRGACNFQLQTNSPPLRAKTFNWFSISPIRQFQVHADFRTQCHMKQNQTQKRHKTMRKCHRFF